MKRIFMLGLVLGLVGASLSAARASDEPKPGGTLVVGIRRDIQLMNPLVGTRSTERDIRELMYEPLLAIDEKGNIQPNLAEQWEMSDNGKLVTFRLRQGVRFHDGREMTAEDVKFSADYTRNPKTGAYGFRSLSLVDRIETEGKYTVKMVLKKPSMPFLSSMTSIQSFSIVPKESLAENIRQPKRFPPGTGPFKFIEWLPKQRVVLERHDSYWGHKALVEKVILRTVGNNTARLTALRAGDVDMIERVPHEWVKQIQLGKLKGLRLEESPTDNFRRLIFNVGAPPFNDKKLREAVALAINKEEILHGGFFGMGEPVNQRYPKGNKWHIKGIPGHAYDLERARQLVKASGYKGEPIKMIVEQSDQRQAEAVTFQSQVKKIGLNLEFHVGDRSVYNDLRRKGDFALVFSGGSPDPDPTDTYAPYYSCERNLKKRRNNASGYCDKEMDLLFAKLETEPDTNKREELLTRILTKLNEDLPEIPIGFVPRHFALRDHVKGFKTNDNASLIWRGGGLNYTWLDK